MAFSVNTNAQAFIALQNLNATTRDLTETQNRISTGLEVAGAEDNAAFFAIAQNLRGDVAGLNAVQGSLDNAASALDVALSAGEAVSDLLVELQGLGVSASDPGISDDSRRALNDQFRQLVTQIDSIVGNAEFNGINAVDGSDAIVALTDPDPSTTNNISITGADLSAGGLSLSNASIGSASAASGAISVIGAAVSTIAAVLSRFGAGANRLEIQSEFTQSLTDTIEVGIGNLVDADLAQESANLQALQVRQQLGLQALSIANQAPGAILSLFGG
jgi:flagellin